MLPTAERVRERLSYDPATGQLSRVGKPGNAAYGIQGKKYLRVKYGTRHFKAHRVAWLLMTGEWPTLQIDHINGDPTDNRWVNLRLATPSQNCRNAKPREGRVGLKGVVRSGKKWGATIFIEGKRRWLGVFEAPEEAHSAYCEEAKKVFGEFARYV